MTLKRLDRKTHRVLNNALGKGDALNYVEEHIASNSGNLMNEKSKLYGQYKEIAQALSPLIKGTEKTDEILTTSIDLDNKIETYSTDIKEKLTEAITAELKIKSNKGVQSAYDKLKELNEMYGKGGHLSQTELMESIINSKLEPYKVSISNVKIKDKTVVESIESLKGVNARAKKKGIQSITDGIISGVRDESKANAVKVLDAQLSGIEMALENSQVNGINDSSLNKIIEDSLGKIKDAKAKGVDNIDAKYKLIEGFKVDEKGIIDILEDKGKNLSADAAKDPAAVLAAMSTSANQIEEINGKVGELFRDNPKYKDFMAGLESIKEAARNGTVRGRGGLLEIVRKERSEVKEDLKDDYIKGLTKFVDSLIKADYKAGKRFSRRWVKKYNEILTTENPLLNGKQNLSGFGEEFQNRLVSLTGASEMARILSDITSVLAKKGGKTEKSSEIVKIITDFEESVKHINGSNGPYPGMLTGKNKLGAAEAQATNPTTFSYSGHAFNDVLQINGHISQASIPENERKEYEEAIKALSENPSNHAAALRALKLQAGDWLETNKASVDEATLKDMQDRLNKINGMGLNDSLDELNKLNIMFFAEIATNKNLSKKKEAIDAVLSKEDITFINQQRVDDFDTALKDDEYKKWAEIMQKLNTLYVNSF